MFTAKYSAAVRLSRTKGASLSATCRSNPFAMSRDLASFFQSLVLALSCGVARQERAPSPRLITITGVSRCSVALFLLFPRGESAQRAVIRQKTVKTVACSLRFPLASALDPINFNLRKSRAPND